MSNTLVSKGEQTKKYIIERSAPIFNQKGYAGTSLSDIMEATGLTKGGIYGNFKNKDDIALAAFDYNVNVMFDEFRKAIKSQKDAINKLLTVLGFHKSIMYHPILNSGCPILNTSIEVDDTHPELKVRAIKALDIWKASVVKIIKNGIRYGDIKSDISPDKYADVLISLVEGGLMMAKLHHNTKPLKNIYEHIKDILYNKLKA